MNICYTSMQRMKCLKRIKSRTEENYMELVNGRPTDTQDRLDKEIRVYDFLDSLGVVYQRIDHVGKWKLCPNTKFSRPWIGNKR